MASPAMVHWGTSPLELAHVHQFGNIYSHITPVGSGSASEHQYTMHFPHTTVYLVSSVFQFTIFINAKNFDCGNSIITFLLKLLSVDMLF